MAKVMIEYDTDTKDLVLSINGEQQEDVQEVGVYTYEYEEGSKEGHIDIRYKPTKKDGIKTYKHSIANYINDKEILDNYFKSFSRK